MSITIEWIELCRTLGMVLVVAVHAHDFGLSTEFKESHFVSSTLFSAFIRFVVPMFFFISGFLMK